MTNTAGFLAVSSVVYFWCAFLYLEDEKKIKTTFGSFIVKNSVLVSFYVILTKVKSQLRKCLQKVRLKFSFWCHDKTP